MNTFFIENKVNFYADNIHFGLGYRSRIVEYFSNICYFR